MIASRLEGVIVFLQHSTELRYGISRKEPGDTTPYIFKIEKITHHMHTLKSAHLQSA